jgi:hypothetical protein
MFNSKNEKSVASTSKVINPGTVKVRLNDLILESLPYAGGSLQIQLQLESEPVQDESFVGLPIDRMDPSKGNYKGQVARVKAQPYLFTDYTYNGNTTTKETQVYKWLIRMADSIGMRAQLDTVEASSIEEYVTKAARVLCSPVHYFFATIAGEEYDKLASDGNTYTSYRLQLPKSSREKFPLATDASSPKFMEFNPAEHIKKKKPVEVVEEFAPTASPEFGSAMMGGGATMINPFADDLDLG